MLTLGGEGGGLEKVGKNFTFPILKASLTDYVWLTDG